MTTDTLKVNVPQKESAASTTKRVWVKPTIEVISVLSGNNPRLHEHSVGTTIKSVFAS